MYLKTVKHLLRLFLGLKEGQLEISPSKEDNIYAWKSHYMFKHLMARFKTIDIGCKWHEAALPQAIIPYCTREFIKLWYNIRNAWLFT